MVFIALSTQWRTGMSGPTGIDYSAIQAVLRLKGIPRKAWAGIFDDLRIMENEALMVMSEDT